MSTDRLPEPVRSRLEDDVPGDEAVEEVRAADNLPGGEGRGALSEYEGKDDETEENVPEAKARGRLSEYTGDEEISAAVKPKTEVPKVEAPTNVYPSKKTSTDVKRTHDDRLDKQKEAFTGWMNDRLQLDGGPLVEDLFADLRNGRVLHRLLEIVFSERLRKLSRGNMRIHHMENVETCLAFLRLRRVPVGTVGNAEIVDGNPKAVMGLVWTVILHVGG